MAAAEQDLKHRLLRERESVVRFVRQFEEEKQRYFAEIEGEVVKLSLAIAERVLHREAKMDPTLLAGAARVALDQVSDSSEAVLRVSPSEAEGWKQTIGLKHVVIEVDEELPRGEAVLKTRSGTVQLGMRAQLLEIERGFFELLKRRPPMAA
jgi:flagellar assembly protein FliH